MAGSQVYFEIFEKQLVIEGRIRDGKMGNFISELVSRSPKLASSQEAMTETVACLERTYRLGGKILVGGNGGSAADSEHIVAELMKGFLLKRALPPTLRGKLRSCPVEVVNQLQMGIPAISLVGNIGFQTAFANDVCYELGFAQQLLNLGKAGDCFIGLSTSGNSRNVIVGMMVARDLGLTTIGLTGASGGKMRELADILIAAPSTVTPHIQEYHLMIYHALCAELEQRLFG